MPSPQAAALSARLRAIAQTVGPGWPTGSGPPTVLDAARAQLADLSAGATSAWRTAESAWTGAAADRAAAVTAATVSEVERLAAELDRMSVATTRAGEVVARARERLDAIIAEFERRAAELEATLDGPDAERAVAAEGRAAIDEANTVVDGLRTDLAGPTAAVTPRPVTTAPQAAIPSGGFGMPGGLGSSTGGGGMAAQSAGWSGLDSGFDSASAGGAPTPDAALFGDGVSVSLPDGSTATAPNEVAASAVRHALTQLGVPYDWGGTSPGVGLDCSGLTQWAYHEAGLDLPRLAQEQDIGTAINRGSLRPGDLAVWDGHVAMVVGNGMMIEAGDPVSLSPIRTTNAGQGFQGFWRPTA